MKITFLSDQLKLHVHIPVVEPTSPDVALQFEADNALLLTW